MLSVLRSSSDNHIAYDSKSSNDVLNSFETSRKNLALCGTKFIDVTLALPANECMKSVHALCNHARIVQIENYHQNDLVKGKHRNCMKFRFLPRWLTTCHLFRRTFTTLPTLIGS